MGARTLFTYCKSIHNWSFRYTYYTSVSNHSFHNVSCKFAHKNIPKEQGAFLRHAICQRNLGHTNTLHNLLPYNVCNIQKRDFSLRETFESAVSTHSFVFKAISESSVVQFTQNSVVYIHEITGLPWWLTIVCITCSVRCFLTVPLAIYQSYVIARLENVRKEMDEIRNDLRHDMDREIRKKRLSQKIARAHFLAASRKEWKRLIERDNCHPAKAAILAFIQIPTWVIFSTAFRNLVYMLPNQDAAAAVTKLGLSMQGLPWCTNLTVPDSFIIPIMLGLTNLVIIEVQAMMHEGQKTRLRKYISNFFRGFSIFMIPVAATVPSAVSLYWLTSSVFGLCQNLLVASPRIRRLCNFPPTASFNPHPYTHLAQQIKSKFRS